MEPLEPEAEDLSLFAEEGVLPMTTAPEDTSFLEAAGDIDIGLPAMSDEPLVEPDLSDFDLETDELEPRLEIDEELPLASLEPEIEEVTLGLEAGPDYIAEESAAEAEMLEPVPEIEETSYADINLHEEPQGHPSSDLESLSELDLDGEGGLETLSDSEFLPVAEEPSIDEDLVLSAYEGPDGESAFEPPKPEFSPPAKKAAQPEAARQPAEKAQTGDGDRLKSEIKSVLSYLDKLLDSLPEEKIEEFARSEYFDTYKKLFEELGLV